MWYVFLGDKGLKGDKGMYELTTHIWANETLYFQSYTKHKTKNRIENPWTIGIQNHVAFVNSCLELKFPDNIPRSDFIFSLNGFVCLSSNKSQKQKPKSDSKNNNYSNHV